MSKLWVPDKSLHLPPLTRMELATVPTLGGFIEIGVWDTHHRIVHQKREPMRSPVLAFARLLAVQISNQTIAITDTGNTGRSVVANAVSFRAVAALADDAKGIVVGTDATAVDIIDKFLATKIAHGTGSGQLIHNAVNFDTDVTIADPDITFSFYRNFNNSSGASITVRETAIYGLGYYTTNANFCLVRDVPTAVAVANGAGCYVRYTIKITE